MKSNPIKILIVEDDPIVAMDIESTLHRMEYVVVGIVDNGPEAIQKTSELHPDLILMDIKLRGLMDGIEAASVIREKYNPPIVFLTAFADEESLQRSKTAEPYGYIQKPFIDATLYATLEIAIRKHGIVEFKKKEIQTALDMVNGTFRMFANSVSDYGIFLISEKNKIISWNPGAERVTGFNASEIVGKDAADLFPIEDRKIGAPGNHTEIAKAMGQHEVEAWLLRKDGSKFWASITTAAIRDSAGDILGYGKVVRDLTSKRNIENTLRRAIEARDEFLATVSHDLKTPLSTLKLQLQMSERELPAQENELSGSNLEIKQSLSLCLRQVDMLSNIVEELLDLAIVQSSSLALQKNEINLSSLITEIVKNNSDKLKAVHCKVKLNLIDNIKGYWDGRRIEQVLTNLLDKIVKYAPDSQIKIATSIEDHIAKILIQDLGPGISRNDQDKIFEGLERSSSIRNISGLGLGLYVVKRLAEAHSGGATESSRRENGSQFVIELPMISGA